MKPAKWIVLPSALIVSPSITRIWLDSRGYAPACCVIANATASPNIHRIYVCPARREVSDFPTRQCSRVSVHVNTAPPPNIGLDPTRRAGIARDRARDTKAPDPQPRILRYTGMARPVQGCLLDLTPTSGSRMLGQVGPPTLGRGDHAAIDPICAGGRRGDAGDGGPRGLAGAAGDHDGAVHGGRHHRRARPAHGGTV